MNEYNYPQSQTSFGSSRVGFGVASTSTSSLSNLSNHLPSASSSSSSSTPRSGIHQAGVISQSSSLPMKHVGASVSNNGSTNSTAPTSGSSGSRLASLNGNANVVLGVNGPNSSSSSSPPYSPSPQSLLNNTGNPNYFPSDVPRFDASEFPALGDGPENGITSTSNTHPNSLIAPVGHPHTIKQQLAPPAPPTDDDFPALSSTIGPHEHPTNPNANDSRRQQRSGPTHQQQQQQAITNPIPMPGFSRNTSANHNSLTPSLSTSSLSSSPAIPNNAINRPSSNNPSSSSSSQSASSLLNHQTNLSLNSSNPLSSSSQPSLSRPPLSSPSSSSSSSSSQSSSNPPSASNSPSSRKLTADRYGMHGLLSVIRMTDPDLNTLALGTDLTTLGLNLNSSDMLYSTFSWPLADNPSKQEPDYVLPLCYYQQPPPLKTSHLAKFTLETLFYIFYNMPKDMLQVYAAKELYNREWRYHKDLKLWFTRPSGGESNNGVLSGSGTSSSGPGGGVSNPSSTSNPDNAYIYFDINTWERRLFRDVHLLGTANFMTDEELATL